MRPTFSIAHKATPERVRSLANMRSVLGQWPCAGVYVEDSPGQPHEWSERQWYGALTFEDATHCVMLNDDLELPGEFGATLAKVLEVRPDHIIHLGNAGTEPTQADAMGLRWVTSRNGLVGNGYAMPRPVLVDFMAWRMNDLKPGTVEATSEDHLLNLYAMARGALIWHCVPALYSLPPLPSLYGNEKNYGRECTVGPRKGMSELDWSTDGLHAGRIKSTEAYEKLPYKLVSSLKVPLMANYFACMGE